MKKKIIVTLAGVLTASAAIIGCAGNTAADNSGAALSTGNAPAETSGVTASGEAASESTSESGTSYDTNEFSNDYFKITMPEEVEGLYEVETTNDSISIFEKKSKEDGFGGLVVTFRATEEFAGGPYEKIGEVSDSNAVIYDLIKGYATEIQWNYEEPDMPEAYKKLEDCTDVITGSIEGVNGFNYTEGAGTKGEDLYNTVLAKYVKAANEGWDSSKYEEEGMSPEFAGVSTEEIGFSYMDINVDGIEELFVGIISDDTKNIAYDVYTIAGHAPAIVASGSAESYYCNDDDVFLANEYVDGEVKGFAVYNLDTGSTVLTYQWGVKYDEGADAAEPWFKGYSQDEYEKITKEDYEREITISDNYRDFQYQPLSGNEDAVALAELN